MRGTATDQQRKALTVTYAKFNPLIGMNGYRMILSIRPTMLDRSGTRHITTYPEAKSMLDKTSHALLASAAALSLALSQAALAQTQISPSGQAPAATAPVAPAAPAAQVATMPAPPAQQAILPSPAMPMSPAPMMGAAPTETPVAAAPAAPAQTLPTPPIAPTPPPLPAASTLPDSGFAAQHEAAQKRMEERQAEMMAKRKQRYEELRKRAEAAGLSLPETPPWEEIGFMPPEMPEMPPMPEMPKMPWGDQPPAPGMEGMGPGASGQDWRAWPEQAWQSRRERASQRGADLPDQAPWNLMTPEERRAQMEQMRAAATPEERAALRDQHWAQLRERAAAQGMSLPENPPWKEAEKRREAMKAQWEKYRKIFTEMSAEQREAAAALFGQMPQPPAMPEMPTMPDMGKDMVPPLPFGRDIDAPRPWGYPPFAPGYNGPGFGGPAYGGYGQPGPWSGSNPGQMSAPMMRPDSGYNRW